MVDAVNHEYGRYKGVVIYSGSVVGVRYGRTKVWWMEGMVDVRYDRWEVW